MMNSRARLSVVAAFAIYTFMGFTPGALGQGTASGKAEGGTIALSQTFLNQTPTGLLVLALGPGADYGRPQPPKPQPPKNGCGNQNGGWDQRGGGNCNAVPEGGTTFLYLSLVGLCCVATAIFSIRRQSRVR